MRPFYLLSAVAIAVVAWLIYTQFFSKDSELQSATPAQNVVVKSSAQGLSPEQVRNRKEIIRTYERQLRDTTNAKDRKALQDKINAIQKEIAGL